jgi:hypothetical protein
MLTNTSVHHVGVTVGDSIEVRTEFESAEDTPFQKVFEEGKVGEPEALAEATE